MTTGTTIGTATGTGDPGRDAGGVTAPAVASRRAVFGLAVPALGVLAAEPLYVLVDTAVVGHLGAVSLGALGIGGALLSQVAVQFNFLAYGTTSRAARWYGAGQRDAAVNEGVQASWFALAPFILLSVAGNGWMRGVRETRRPLAYALAANLVSAVLNPLLVYPAGLGLAGSAIANVTAQAFGGVLFVRALASAGVPLRPHPAVMRAQLRLARDLVVRTLGMQACFLAAAGVAARMGTAQIAAHQIALQLWVFLALVLDAFAIAAQALVGGALGGGDAALAHRIAWRVARYGAATGAAFAVGLLAGWYAVPALFTADPDVLAQAHLAWPWFAAMQPAAGVVFALDGVLIGAGDVPFLRTLTVGAGLLGFLPMTLVAYAAGLGLGGVWAGLTLFVLIRLVGMVLRTRHGAWAVTGADLDASRSRQRSLRRS